MPSPSTSRFIMLNSAHTATASCSARSSQPAASTASASAGVILAGLGELAGVPPQQRLEPLGDRRGADVREQRRQRLPGDAERLRGGAVHAVAVPARVQPGHVRDLLTAVFAREGIEVRTGTPAEGVSHDGRQFTVRLDGRELTAQQLLVATGRRTDLPGLGAAAAGLDAGARTIAVDDRMRAAERVWAVGDITGVSAHTHMAMYQADVAVRDILGAGGPGADYRAVPGVTFTDPEIGQAGLTEAQAREQGIDMRTGITQVPSSARGWIHKAGNDGFIKLVADARRGVLVGATSTGPAGGEVLGALVVAIHGEVPVARLKTMIYAYPTFHRAIETAVADLGIG